MPDQRQNKNVFLYDLNPMSDELFRELEMNHGVIEQIPQAQILSQMQVLGVVRQEAKTPNRPINFFEGLLECENSSHRKAKKENFRNDLACILFGVWTSAY